MDVQKDTSEQGELNQLAQAVQGELNQIAQAIIREDPVDVTIDGRVFKAYVKEIFCSEGVTDVTLRLVR